MGASWKGGYSGGPGKGDQGINKGCCELTVGES